MNAESAQQKIFCLKSKTVKSAQPNIIAHWPDVITRMRRGTHVDSASYQAMRPSPSSMRACSVRVNYGGRRYFIT